MIKCDRCEMDVDIEGWFTIQEGNNEFVYSLCGFCAGEVKKFIEKGV